MAADSAPETISPFDLVIFGGSGDLAMRKLLPALYHRHRSGELPESGRVIGLGRRQFTDDEYRASALEGCKRFVAEGEFTDEDWTRFAKRLCYRSVDATASDDYAKLAATLTDTARTRVFYLATSPNLFTVVCEHLAQHALVTPASRVVLEKPIGRDLASARQINAQVGAVFEEQQIYRIDHYLGKETVQNLMALRFGNALFEPLWRRGWISDVQITVAETIGVEGRGEYYDRAGAMRDMVQNHILQMLCIIAMEPPISVDSDSVRDEKLKVLSALDPLEGKDALQKTVRAQYVSGAIGTESVPGFLQEDDIPGDSTTETYATIRAEINNWRWAGVPFYLRTGKRLRERVSEIVVNFREVPHLIFESHAGRLDSNRLVIRLQPQEGVHLHLMAKARGDEMVLRPVELNLDFAETYKSRQADAYEPLLMDVLRGKPTLFMRRDEVDAAWTYVEPILDAWGTDPRGVRTYNAGTWGPAAASVLIGNDGLSWHEDV